MGVPNPTLNVALMTPAQPPATPWARNSAQCLNVTFNCALDIAITFKGPLNNDATSYLQPVVAWAPTPLANLSGDDMGWGGLAVGTTLELSFSQSAPSVTETWVLVAQPGSPGTVGTSIYNNSLSSWDIPPSIVANSTNTQFTISASMNAANGGASVSIVIMISDSSTR